MAADNCRFSKGVKVNGFDDVPRPFLIGVGGGTASGKTTVCNNIMEQLGQNEQQQKQVAILSMESFYVPPTAEQETLIRKGQYNFDHPSAFDDGLLLSTLRDIKAGKRVRVPEYDFANNCRKLDTRRTIEPVDVILFEGILTFYFKEVRELFDMKLFVDTDPDTRLSRREIANKNSKFRNRFLNYLFNDTKPLYIVMRDMKVWGRDLDQILYQYTNFVKPAFEDFCLPTKKYADVIIPRGADNKVAIDLIVQHIQELLKPNRHSRTRRVRHNSDNMVSRPH